jgi:hypothetical protein
MRLSYHLKVVSHCPVDGKRDVYETEVRSERQINVEEILALSDEYTTASMFQEALTLDMAQKLGAEVITKGYHSGVLVVAHAP